jgi:hypothetical protein
MAKTKNTKAKTKTSTKPVVRGPVSDNIFAILGASTRALKAAGKSKEAKDLTNKVMTAESYDEALQECMGYVDFDI